MLRIGLLTSGGDCQALNATMRGVVKGLANNVKDLEVYGFMNGYKGLIYSDYRMLSAKDFSGILTQGGTILGTSRQPFKLMRTPDANGLDKVEAMKHTYHKLLLELHHKMPVFFLDRGLVILRGDPQSAPCLL